MLNQEAEQNTEAPPPAAVNVSADSVITRARDSKFFDKSFQNTKRELLTEFGLPDNLKLFILAKKDDKTLKSSTFDTDTNDTLVLDGVIRHTVYPPIKPIFGLGGWRMRDMDPAAEALIAVTFSLTKSNGKRVVHFGTAHDGTSLENFTAEELSALRKQRGQITDMLDRVAKGGIVSHEKLLKYLYDLDCKEPKSKFCAK